MTPPTIMDENEEHCSIMSTIKIETWLSNGLAMVEKKEPSPEEVLCGVPARLPAVTQPDQGWFGLHRVARMSERD